MAMDTVTAIEPGVGEAGLLRAMSGDYEAIELEDADTMWGNFAMHVNVVINATRTALTRAEKFEREAAEARERAREACCSAGSNSLSRPQSVARPRNFVIDSDDRTPR